MSGDHQASFEWFCLVLRKAVDFRCDSKVGQVTACGIFHIMMPLLTLDLVKMGFLFAPPMVSSGRTKRQTREPLKGQ